MDGEKRIATLGKGEMFGEMGLLSGQPRNATAVASESCSFFILTEQSLHRLFTKRVAIVMLLNIVRKLSDRLREADELIGFKQ
jgi:CRP-like cAMP-binding protein